LYGEGLIYGVFAYSLNFETIACEPRKVSEKIVNLTLTLDVSCILDLRPSFMHQHSIQSLIVNVFPARGLITDFASNFITEIILNQLLH